MEQNCAKASIGLQLIQVTDNCVVFKSDALETSDAAQLPQQLPGSFGRPSLPGAEGSAEGPGALQALQAPQSRRDTGRIWTS